MIRKVRGYNRYAHDYFENALWAICRRLEWDMQTWHTLERNLYHFVDGDRPAALRGPRTSLCSDTRNPFP